MLVIGRPDRDEADAAAQRAGERLGQEVNVTIRSGRWWQEGTDSFHAEVTRRPIVAVLAAAEQLPLGNPVRHLVTAAVAASGRDLSGSYQLADDASRSSRCPHARRR